MDDKYEIEVQERFIFLEYFVNGDRQKEMQERERNGKCSPIPFSPQSYRAIAFLLVFFVGKLMEDVKSESST